MLKLQPLLNEYLVENGILPLAGIGQLCIERKQAAMQEANTTIEPPQSSILFSSEAPSEMAVEKLTAFIANRLSVSPQQVARLLVEAGNLASAFAEKETMQWPPFGTIQKEQEGSLHFQQETGLSTYLPVISLPQQRPLSQPETPLVVDETVATTASSEPVYEPDEPVRKGRWWVWAIVILVVSVLLILLRFLG